MDEDTFVVPEIAELVRLDFGFLGLIIIHIVLAGAVAPGTFHDPFLAKKIRALHGILLVRCTENHPVAKIQRQYFGFVVSERRDE